MKKSRATLERELAETKAILGDLLEERGEDTLEKIRRKAQHEVIGSLYEASDDYSDRVLEDLLVEAGWLWRCEEEHCGYTNPAFIEECENPDCRGRRPDDPRLRR